jgi:hypothetical protein
VALSHSACLLVVGCDTKTNLTRFLIMGGAAHDFYHHAFAIFFHRGIMPFGGPLSVETGSNPAFCYTKVT